MKPLKSLTIQPYNSAQESYNCVLPPLMEIPCLEEFGRPGSRYSRAAAPYWSCVKLWVRDQVEKASSYGGKRSDVQLLLGVLGSPLAPMTSPPAGTLPQICVKDDPISASSAQYIVHQYIGATTGEGAGSVKTYGGGWMKNFYAMGKLQMVASELEAAGGHNGAGMKRSGSMTRRGSAAAEAGCFVLWQMAPEVWCVELSLGGCKKVRAGSNGKVVWRHTPWMGSHRVKGPVRPLRRALQGLDPWTIGNMFAHARCVGEKTIEGQPCFILKLVADPATLEARSDGPAEIIRHVMLGYFSQKTGFLLQLEDSYLLRVQSPGSETVYWETSTETRLEEYRGVEGGPAEQVVHIPHVGRSVLTLFRFGESAMSHTRTRLEENWIIEEVAFNVPGVSSESFIPPADLHDGPIFSDDCELTVSLDSARSAATARLYTANISTAKVAALDKLTPLAHGDVLDQLFPLQSRHHP